ncbi:MAG: aminopeptidase [Acholeplasmataceae bacterium]|nr:aminopeptidase [Acholeplasmataceae bacterium]
MEVLIKKLARLAVRVGANVQKDQVVILRANLDSKDLAKEIVSEAYLAGAKKVIVEWNYEHVSKLDYIYMSDDTLKDIPDYVVSRARYQVDSKACFISISSPMPGLFAEVDPMKFQIAAVASQEKLSFVREHLMGNQVQWTIVSAANQMWANKVFPNLKDEEALKALWKAIYDASRVYYENDIEKEWNTHNENLKNRSDILNRYNFKELHFKNSLGTDLIVGLVEEHIWVGGGEVAANGVYFNPNIPTEEIFTMPHKFMTQGKVVATKPLNYSGKLIEDFYLVFKDGKVVEYDAKKEKETLKNILTFDDNSSYIGEIALIGDNSPINNTGILFYNTLFDENASCHMALGRAYPMNIKGGIGADIKELEKKGYNNSNVHVDFMFGSPDLEITGTTYDGEKIKVFEKGNFII